MPPSRGASKAGILAACALLALAGLARGEPGPAPVAPPPGPAAAPPSATSPAGELPAATAPPLAPPPTEAAPAAKVGPVPTADVLAAVSDHDAVVGHIGIEARRFDPGPLPLALRPAFGCPAAQTTPCEVTLGALGARYWTSRNLAWNGGLVFGVGGGRDDGASLDTYFGIGPVVGLTLLLGNWRHLAVGASPEVAMVWFRPGPSAATGSTTMLSLRAALEGELHFGFVGVPALSIGIVSGLGLQYESGPGARVWSVSVIGAESVWGTLTNLFVRYYL
jgi:hypothetical protein